MKPTLEQYLRQSFEAGIIDHTLRADIDAKGRVSFYIHPAGKDGDTSDFVVIGNRLELPRKTVAEIKIGGGRTCPWCEAQHLQHIIDHRAKKEWFRCTTVFCEFESEVAPMVPVPTV